MTAATNPWLATDDEVVLAILDDTLAGVRDGMTLWMAINCARFNAEPRCAAGERATTCDRVVEYAIACAKTAPGEAVRP